MSNKPMTYLQQRHHDKLYGKPAKEQKVYKLKKSEIKPKGAPTRKKADACLVELLKLAQMVFNRWIRKRDAGKPCISCKNKNPTEAGHFYSAASFSGLRFEETNVHLQCNDCNCHKGSNQEAYQKAMAVMYSSEHLARLENLARLTALKKWDREDLEHIITKYK